MEKQNVLIMGAAGRDFHNFNVFFRTNESFNVVAFTATQIPDIAGRKYPPELSGPLYPEGIPIFPEDDLTELIKENKELLQTVFIISNLEVEENQRSNEEKLGVKIEQAEGEKCERCWMYSTTVGEDKENPTICHRCSETLKL